MLELKKKELEKMKVTCAKAEMEMRIFEHEENISRLNDNIKIQDDRLIIIDEEIKELTQ